MTYYTPKPDSNGKYISRLLRYVLKMTNVHNFTHIFIDTCQKIMKLVLLENGVNKISREKRIT